MLVVDSNRLLCLSGREVAALGPSKLSDPAAFERFAEILDLSEDVILEAAEARFAVSTTKDVFDTVILDLLPKCADPEKLLEFDYLAIRITGIGEYCLASVAGRLVAFDGLPTDGATGEEVLSFEIAPEVFLAYCRGLLLELSDRIVEDDDELDDVALTDTELDLYNVHGGEATGITCYKDTGNCSANAVAGATCYMNETTCAAKAFAGGACYKNASACAAVAGAGAACYQNASACAVDAGVGACGANATACSGNVVAGACAANAAACAGNVGVGNVGLNVGACAGKASVLDLSPVDACAARACALDLCTLPCAADVCPINIFPFLPSC